MVISKKNHLLVTGSHRSGTTFMGKLLAKSEYFYIQEPFNRTNGIYGVNHWFPYPDEYYRNLVNSFFALKAKAKRGVDSDPSIKKVLKNFVGSKLQWKLNFYKLKNQLIRILIKDPNAAFLSDYMFSNFNLDVIVMIRHPVSFYVSLKRLNWTFNFNELLSQKELCDKFYTEEDIGLFKNIDSFEEMAGVLWYAIYKVLDQYNKKYNRCDNWIVLRHEDFSCDPSYYLSQLANRLNLKITPSMNEFIEKNIFSGKVEARKDKVLDFKRNAGKLAWAFKDMVPSEIKNTIKKHTWEIAQNYYDETEW